MRLHPYGRSAVLVETDDPPGLARAADRVAGVVESVPAARTVLVTFVDGAARAAAEPALRGLRPLPTKGEDRRLVEVATRYDGPDLAEVARLADLSVDEVVALHTGREHMVDFVGFAPGFAYLSGVAEPLHVPRRASPRTTVPPGSVALAGGLTAVYPRSSPGGWQLVGSTDLVTWDLSRDEPATFRPGDRVRFVAVER